MSAAGSPGDGRDGNSRSEEIRARLSRLRRPKSRRRIAVLVVLFVAALGVLSVSPVARIRSVEIRGLQAGSEPQLHPTLDLVGESIFWVDAGGVEEQLAKIPWVQRAGVRKNFLKRTLEVDLVRRSVAAFVRGSQGVVLVDVSGMAYEVTSTIPSGVLEITGEIGPVSIGTMSREISTVIFCAESLSRWSKEPFRSGGVSSGIVFLVTVGGSAVRVGDTSDLDAKGRALRAMQERAAAEGWKVSQYNVVAPKAPALEKE